MTKTIDPDTQALIDNSRAIAAQQKADAEARDKAAEANADRRAKEAEASIQRRAKDAEANTDRRHKERMKHELEMQRTALAVFQSLPPDPTPALTPGTTKPPLTLTDEQAQRMLVQFAPQWDTVVKTVADVHAHWATIGRKEWLAGTQPMASFVF